VLQSKLPLVERLTLAIVTSVPEWHPEHEVFAPFPVHAWVIRHPEGAILVDIGVGLGNEAIDEWYHPQSIRLTAALEEVGLAPPDIAGVVLSHLRRCSPVASSFRPLWSARHAVRSHICPGGRV